MQCHILSCHGVANYNRAVNEGLFLISDIEAKFLLLNKPFVIPGKPSFSLAASPKCPAIGTKRPIEDLATGEGSKILLTNSQGPTLDDCEPYGVASGSARKQMRTAQSIPE
ncbi:hypothetical protein RHS03_09061, partial [Rhizoctonia solani]